MTDLSVLTIARGRETHLRNVLLGLVRQTRQPDEVVIAAMQPELYDLPETPFPVRQVRVRGEALPLAAARNAAVEAAKGDKLLFVDVDCIPAPDFVADYEYHLDALDGVMMGEVLYLPDGATAPGWSYADFARLGVKHSERRGPPEGDSDPCEDYRCFWSLNFALSRRDFERSGGFDPRYVGYGGEDTDFGRVVSEAGIPIHWVRGARVYHQYHPHHMPPVHHLRSVIRNSELFAEKWGHHTMEHWLRAFRLMGLIERTSDGIRVLREPDESDRDLTGQQAHQPFASSARVMEQLEEMAVAAQ